MISNRPFAALCAVTSLVVVCLSGCGPTSPGSPPTSGGGSAQPSTMPASPAGTKAGAAMVAVAVYYLGEERLWREADGQPIDQIKLYREFHRVPAGDGGPQARTAAAVAAMLDQASAYDPDYRSGWPSGAHVRQVGVDSDAVMVDLSGAATNSVGAEVAHQAVQQLVWTATAASGKPGVRLLLDGEPVSELWGHAAVGGVLRRAPAVDVLAHVWLIDPQHSATVARTFTIHVSGSVFESTIQVRVRQGDRTVSERYVTVGTSPAGKFGEAKTTVTLSPGSYIVEVYAESAVDGREMFLDNHTITVG